MRYYGSILLGLLFLTLFSCRQNKGSSDWTSLETAEDLWRAHPDQVRYLLGELDGKALALTPVRALLSKGDTAAARRLLQHYEEADREWVVAALDPLAYEEAESTARVLLADSIVLHDVAAAIPFNADGGWQWDYTGPVKDDEFGYSLNGHAYLPALWKVWQNTDDPAYARLFDRIVKDWVLHHPLPAEGDSIYLVLDTTVYLDYRDIGEVEWRTLEAGRRLGATWPQLFYGFQSSEAFTPATRLLMLSSMAKQADYLRRYHKQGHNWTTMEMNGLALTGLAFPEFARANEWADYALQVMTREINRQVYPDGVQTEVSTKTQWVALRRFESLARNFQRAGRQISEPYVDRIEEMYNYLAYAMRPDGHQPLNNDADREDLRPRVLAAAEKFNRPDWRWIATNGNLGVLPERGPSVVFPWAGIHVMRNGWAFDAQWAFFDTGPYGTGHQHRDKLHLSIAAFGKDLLVDGGRYTHEDYFSFDPAIWRGYFRSSFSHNVLLVDGAGQNAGPERAEAPLREGADYARRPDYGYAHGVFDSGYENVEGEAVHQRSVLYLRDRFWIVLDQLDTDRPRDIQALWHYAPDCTVELEGVEASSTNEDEANLRIVPLGEVTWRPEIVTGREEPPLQGWYSETYGKKEPNPTVVYRAQVDQPAVFAWILAPALGELPDMEANLEQRTERVVVSVTVAGQAPVEVTLPLGGGAEKVRVRNF